MQIFPSKDILQKHQLGVLQEPLILLFYHELLPLTLRRVQNRIAEVEYLTVNAGLVILAVFVLPYKKDCQNIRSIVKDNNFVKNYVNTSVEECKRLDKKVCASEIKNITDISAPYEAPENPDIEIKTENETFEVVAQGIVYYIILKLLKNNE